MGINTEASLKLAGNFDSDKLKKVAIGHRDGRNRKNLPGHSQKTSERGQNKSREATNHLPSYPLSHGGCNRQSKFLVAPEVP